MATCTARPPAPNRFPSRLESPSGVHRRCSRCKVTEVGWSVETSPTTHIDAPCTILRGTTTLFRYPNRFHSSIMRPEVKITHFDRAQLLEIMHQCFESPFDNPKRDPQASTAVRVEITHRRASAKDYLRSVNFGMGDAVKLGL
ncbi:hypothetical protein B9G98_03005 [Wickerhamiella sorbophila]|uniref:Uncharacterized protein n=1 Tax=Wickerhamiella sorbophila TaxID=45607 RepID=A0A2T0FK87_9ASCO|nr:hypothetical protein B9G98_03005 [Wickerhamiella sorbophila]PRT55385.1 hypothetical protein B9G98_03005 [Wickerhamiella sorbophila]